MSLAPAAAAEIIEIHYEGVVTSSVDDLAILGDLVDATTFSGSLFVDASDVLVDAPNSRAYNITAHSVTIGGRVFEATTARLNVRDDFLTPGPFGVEIDAIDVGGTPALPPEADDGFLELTFEGDNDWFSGLQAPGPDVLDLSNPAVSFGRFSLLFTAGDGVPFFDTSGIGGEVTSVVVVPAPGTAWPIVGVLALARRRR